MREYIQNSNRQHYLEGVLQASKVNNLNNYLSEITNNIINDLFKYTMCVTCIMNIFP
jgi:hypothetical protein